MNITFLQHGNCVTYQSPWTLGNHGPYSTVNGRPIPHKTPEGTDVPHWDPRALDTPYTRSSDDPCRARRLRGPRRSVQVIRDETLNLCSVLSSPHTSCGFLYSRRYPFTLRTSSRRLTVERKRVTSAPPGGPRAPSRIFFSDPTPVSSNFHVGVWYSPGDGGRVVRSRPSLRPTHECVGSDVDTSYNTRSQTRTYTHVSTRVRDSLHICNP